MKYDLKRVPVSLGGPAIVVCNSVGRVVFETKDFDAALTECDRLNAGGAEVVHLTPCEERRERMPDGTIRRIPIVREVRAMDL
jgi:hypothetical protein